MCVCVLPPLPTKADTCIHCASPSFRFSGPATSVKVYCSTDPRLAQQPEQRTLGEAVSETGRRFTHMVLHPRQVGVIHQSLPLVFLTGPPGVGKSLVLVIRALVLLRQQEAVHVVSTWDDSLAASHNIAHQLRQTAAPADRPLIHLHLFNFRDGDQAVRDAVRT